MKMTTYFRRIYA